MTYSIKKSLSSLVAGAMIGLSSMYALADDSSKQDKGYAIIPGVSSSEVEPAKLEPAKKPDSKKKKREPKPQTNNLSASPRAQAPKPTVSYPVQPQEAFPEFPDKYDCRRAYNDNMDLNGDGRITIAELIERAEQPGGIPGIDVNKFKEKRDALNRILEKEGENIVNRNYTNARVLAAREGINFDKVLTNSGIEEILKMRNSENYVKCPESVPSKKVTPPSPDVVIVENEPNSYLAVHSPRFDGCSKETNLGWLRQADNNPKNGIVTVGEINGHFLHKAGERYQEAESLAELVNYPLVEFLEFVKVRSTNNDYPICLLPTETTEPAAPTTVPVQPSPQATPTARQRLEDILRNFAAKLNDRICNQRELDSNDNNEITVDEFTTYLKARRTGLGRALNEAGITREIYRSFLNDVNNTPDIDSDKTLQNIVSGYVLKVCDTNITTPGTPATPALPPAVIPPPVGQPTPTAPTTTPSAPATPATAPTLEEALRKIGQFSTRLNRTTCTTVVDADRDDQRSFGEFRIYFDSQGNNLANALKGVGTTLEDYQKLLDFLAPLERRPETVQHRNEMAAIRGFMVKNCEKGFSMPPYILQISALGGLRTSVGEQEKLYHNGIVGAEGGVHFWLGKSSRWYFGLTVGGGRIIQEKDIESSVSLPDRVERKDYPDNQYNLRTVSTQNGIRERTITNQEYFLRFNPSLTVYLLPWFNVSAGAYIEPRFGEIERTQKWSNTQDNLVNEQDEIITTHHAGPGSSNPEYSGASLAIGGQLRMGFDLYPSEPKGLNLSLTGFCGQDVMSKTPECGALVNIGASIRMGR